MDFVSVVHAEYSPVVFLPPSLDFPFIVRASPPSQPQKRVRVRPRRPRTIKSFVAQNEALRGNMFWLRLYWKDERQFSQEKYEKLEKYLLERNCEVRRRPQRRFDTGGPARTLFVHLERSERNHWAIKQFVSRLGCDMHTEEVENDWFEIDQSFSFSLKGQA